MPRIITVRSAQKDQGNCSVCGKPITQGTAYQWAALKTGPRSSHKIKAHATCRFRQSQLTTSEIKGQIYDAVESAEQAIGFWDGQDLDELRSYLTDAADQIQEAADMCQEKADNIEDGFGHSTMQSEELAERAQNIESFADEVRSAADDIEDYDEGQADQERDTWVEDARQMALDAFQGNPE